MKKKIIYSSVLTALLSASSIALAGGPEIIVEPDYFSGFYIGGIGGVHHVSFDGSSSVVLQQPGVSLLTVIPLIPAGTITTNDVDGGEFAGYGGVQGGFGKVFNHQFYVGLQGFGEWGSASETDNENRFLATPQPINILGVATASATASANSTTTAKIKEDYGIAGKFGWVVAPRSMIYGKVGAVWANLEVSNTSTANLNTGLAIPPSGAAFTLNTATSFAASTSDTQTKIGLLLAVGFEQFVYSDFVSINVEADYTHYGHVSAPPANFNGSTVVNGSLGAAAFGPWTFNFPTTNFTTQASTDATVTSLMAGLNFYFGNNWF